MSSPTSCTACWILCLLLSQIVSAHGDPLSATMRKGDPRLEQCITLAALRLNVGELLEQLSAQAGVILSAEDRDGTAGEQVSVFLRDVSLGDAMDALWSLFSYKRAEWHWRRLGKEGDFRYQLQRPVAARQFATRLQKITQEEFEAQAEVILTSLRMTPEQREKFLKKYAEERLLKGDKQAQDFIHDKSVQSGMSLFAEALPANIQQSVLRGGEAIRVPVSQLSPQGQAFVHSTWTDFRGFRTRPDGTREPIPEPSWVQFRAHRPHRAQVAPVLFMDIGGIGGCGYLGGAPLENAIKQKIEDLRRKPPPTAGFRWRNW